MVGGIGRLWPLLWSSPYVTFSLCTEKGIFFPVPWEDIERISHTSPTYTILFNQHHDSAGGYCCGKKVCEHYQYLSKQAIGRAKWPRTLTPLEERAELWHEPKHVSSCLQHKHFLLIQQGENWVPAKPGACGSNNPSINCSICWDMSVGKESDFPGINILKI